MKSCRLFMCFDYMSQLLADLKIIMILIGLCDSSVGSQFKMYFKKLKYSSRLISNLLGMRGLQRWVTNLRKRIH